MYPRNAIVLNVILIFGSKRVRKQYQTDFSTDFWPPRQLGLNGLNSNVGKHAGAQHFIDSFLFFGILGFWDLGVILMSVGNWSVYLEFCMLVLWNECFVIYR